MPRKDESPPASGITKALKIIGFSFISLGILGIAAGILTSAVTVFDMAICGAAIVGGTVLAGFGLALEHLRRIETHLGGRK